MSTQPWSVSDRFDPAAVTIADRHYNRQKAGTNQFVPPGRCLVLLADGPALWTASWPYARYTKHAWAGAWVNSLFRREGGDVIASALIRAAVAATRAKWADVPPLGIVTFIDASKVRHKRDVGRCYLKAGWKHVGFTKGGLHVFQQLPDEMPQPLPAANFQLSLLDQVS